MDVKKYDVSITHAYEDKDGFANELALALKKAGARIWYSGFDLASNDSIAENMNHALNDSRYAVMIISPAYLQKHPAISEVKALLAKNKHQRIIPVLHNLTAKQVAKQFPALTEKGMISSRQDIDHVAARILRSALFNFKRKTKTSRERTQDGDTGVIVLGGNIHSKNIIGNERHERKRST